MEQKDTAPVWAHLPLTPRGGSPTRQYASFKFFIYTMAGSLGLLLSIQLIGFISGTFDLTKIMQIWPSNSPDLFPNGALFGVSLTVIKNITFWLFVLAFAIKVPGGPFHTWLPDAPTQAPTAGSPTLAGVSLKRVSVFRILPPSQRQPAPGCRWAYRWSCGPRNGP